MQQRGNRRPGKRQRVGKPKALKPSHRTITDLQEQLAARTRERNEALEQLAATSEILKVISHSTFELQTVLATLVCSAGRLCQAENVQIFLRDGDVYRLAADNGFSPEYEQYAREHPIRPGRNTLVARTALWGKTVHIHNSLADPEYTYGGQKLGGYRTLLGAPLIRDGNCIGVMALTRSKVHPFTDNQIELVTNFAAQAVIAIENTRLLNELRESLQQQTATADVLKVISRSAFDLDSVLSTLVTSAARLCGAERGLIFLREGDLYRMASNFGFSPELETFARANPLPADGTSTTARAGAAGEPVQAVDLVADETQGEMARAYQRLGGHKTNLGVPLRRDGETIGVFTLTRQVVQAFTPRQIELVQTFADQAVIAIENARLFEEVQAKTRDLTEALTYQTGSANILNIIASSPTDVAPVLKAIVESACDLCEAYDAVVMLRNGDELSLGAHYGPIPMSQQRWSNDRTSISGRAMADRRPVHVQDVLSDEGADFAIAREMSRVDGCHTLLGAPLLREGESIGAIVLRRTEVSPFSDKQISLLQTFGDQAVIAIENARLFNETREALERQTATADILKVIASSPDNVQPVFQAIADRSKRLVDALSTTVFTLVDGMSYLRAFTPTTPQADAKLQATFPAPLSTLSWGEAIAKGEIYRVIDAEQEPERLRELARERGWRSALLVPLLRDGKPIGIIGPTRAEPGPFTEHHVQLMQTFADQAVIAIQNVELFDKVQQRTRELSKSLDDLRAAQDRLIQTEKLASLGQLTAGIAHEIKNPLNFVNNFAALSVELTDELKGALKPAVLDRAIRAEVDEITGLLKDNLGKVVQHGKRANSIVKNMLLHSREGSGERRSADVNAVVGESLNLAYHGARAEKPGFTITLKHDLDPEVGALELYPQEITRALLNLISNGFYAATRRKAESDDDNFEPVLSATTRNLGETVEIRIRDNGPGIPPEIREKMFNPFFTTKPTGEGTGLGLSMTHDIVVKQHGGRIDVVTELGAFTEFIIILPRDNGTPAGSKSE